MLEFTVDILIIGLLTVLSLELFKKPVKVILVKKGLKDNEMASKIFKAVVTLLSYVGCFIGALLYFHFYLHANPFASSNIIWYTVGTVGASQSIYAALETYGRDGLWQIIKGIITKLQNKEFTDMSKLTAPALDDFAAKIMAGINEYFEDAPITKEDLKAILVRIK